MGQQMGRLPSAASTYTLDCGHDFDPVIVCSWCRTRLKTGEVSYTFNYSTDDVASL